MTRREMYRRARRKSGPRDHALLHSRERTSTSREGMDRDPLALSQEQMREMGYAVVDMLVARIEALRDGPVLRTDTLEAMRKRLDAQAPAGAIDFAHLLGRLD